jgi:two-component system, chemotaxis family, chemotaxis protein CheY
VRHRRSTARHRGAAKLHTGLAYYQYVTHCAPEFTLGAAIACVATILTVDDSAFMRQMVKRTLQTAGHVVVAAIDGVEALEKAHSETLVDLVITDVHMPNMDGLTLVRELRLMPKYRAVPLLVLTSESGDKLKQEGREAGATGWILKPFDPMRLIETIDSVMHQWCRTHAQQ